MSEQATRGISRQGLDAAFDAEEARKSNLLLEAQFLRGYQRHEEAAVKLVQAAEIEQHLADICESKGLLEKSWVHRVSAMSCWGMAGNLHTAIALAEELLARSDLPERLRLRISDYLQTLRRRRAQWFAEAELATAGAER